MGEKIIIEYSECFRTIGITFEALIGSTGIFGFKDFASIVRTNPTLSNISCYYYSKVPNLVYVDLTVDKVRLYRVLNIEDKTIYNSVFANNKCQKKGIGTKILSSQVVSARDAGFVKIKCSAARYEGSDYSVGYIVWGKLGYSMSETSQKQFLQCIGADYPDIDFLYDLLHHTEEGEAFWAKYGDTRDGEFSLQPESINIIGLDFYKSKRCTLNN